MGKPMFVMECLYHILASACKEGVSDVQSYDGREDTEVIRRNMQLCIAWTEKSQNGAKSLDTSQKYLGLPCKGLFTPVKNRFSCLIHSFRYILKNKESINYLYGSMVNIPDRIK